MTGERVNSIANFATGDFCPVGKVGHIDRKVEVLSSCEFCGEPADVAHCDIEASDEEPIFLYTLWPYRTGWHRSTGRGSELFPQPYFDTLSECHSKMCNEVKQYMLGWHHLVGSAKLYKVALRRPLRAYNSATCSEERYMLGCAALLDFIARFEQVATRYKI